MLWAAGSISSICTCLAPAGISNIFRRPTERGERGGRKEKAFREGAAGQVGLVPLDATSSSCCRGTEVAPGVPVPLPPLAGWAPIEHKLLTLLLGGLGQGALHRPAVGVVPAADPALVLLLQGAHLLVAADVLSPEGREGKEGLGPHGTAVQCLLHTSPPPRCAWLHTGWVSGLKSTSPTPKSVGRREGMRCALSPGQGQLLTTHSPRTQML